MEKENKQEFYTINQVASLLGISRASVYRYIKEDKIKATIIGKRQFISKNEIFKG